jgi:hypothetical protein
MPASASSPAKTGSVQSMVMDSVTWRSTLWVVASSASL